MLGLFLWNDFALIFIEKTASSKSFAIFAMLCWIPVAMIGIRLKHQTDARQ
tara:strand:+ start:7404 stop:7556 length:153 start_codon:yes stop_codon:yes gene_type:complete